MKRVDAIVVQVVVTEFDEAGRIVGEELQHAQKVYAAKSPWVEQLVAPLNAQLATPEPDAKKKPRLVKSNAQSGASDQ